MQASPKSERLEARITTEQKALFQRAADLLGRSFTDFAIGILQEAASRVVLEHDVIQLSMQDQRKFVEMLLDPPAPNERLMATVKRYKAIVKE
jgi:uncharacterized protein (DUF1778 family)